jgi:hemerythrin-like domain-containing protein
MIPIGPLMREHRLIERMVEVLRTEIELIDMGLPPDTGRSGQNGRLLQDLADRCHHGKEEDILFNELKERISPPKLKAAMDELIDDHVEASKLVGRIDQGRTADPRRRRIRCAGHSGRRCGELLLALP